MSSIKTNRAAMTALQTLRSITDSVNEGEKHISTGLRIAEASDNLAYWGITNNLKTDSIVMGTVQDSLKVGLSVINQAYQANAQVKKELEHISSSLANAKSNADNPQVLKEIQASIENSLKNIKAAALNGGIEGQNLLVSDVPKKGKDDLDKNDTDEVNFVSSFRRYNGQIITDTIAIKLKETRLFTNKEIEKNPHEASSDSVTLPPMYKDLGLLGMLYIPDRTEGNIFAKKKEFLEFLNGKLKPGSTTEYIKPPATHEEIEKAIDQSLKVVEKASSDVANVDIILGSTKNEISSQIQFVSGLQDNLKKSIGALVDADMDKESAKISALQVQQQLAVQSLSLANQTTQHILQLFKN